MHDSAFWMSSEYNLKTGWRKIRARAGSIYGWLPYGVKLNWGLQVFKNDGYRLDKAIPYLEVTITTLDYVWQWKVYREHGQIKFNWTNPRAADKHIQIAWTLTEGWTIQGTNSGRRTRPLPKFIAAILCGTLIWVYPDILRIAFEHAEKVNKPVHVYIVLVAVTLSFVSMVGIYMWLSYRSDPTGLDRLLRGLGKSMGKNGSSTDTSVQHRSDSEIPVDDPTKTDDVRTASQPSDDIVITQGDPDEKSANSRNGAKDGEHSH